VDATVDYFSGEDDKIVTPTILKDLPRLALLKENRDEAIRNAAEAEFDGANLHIVKLISKIQFDAKVAERDDQKLTNLIAEQDETDTSKTYYVEDPERPITWAYRVTRGFMLVMFLAAIGCLAFTTVNWVIVADIFPTVQGNVFMAVFTTGAAVTCFIFGPISLYSAQRTDTRKRRLFIFVILAAASACLGWVVCMGFVGQLDNFVTLTLTQNPIRGFWSLLNWLLPAGEGVFMFVLMICQILAESLGSVVVEIHAKRHRENYLMRTTVADAKYVYLDEKIDLAKDRASDSAGKVAYFRELEVLLRKKREAYIANCLAALLAIEAGEKMARSSATQQYISSLIGVSADA
jgi:hypothetical protein